MNQTLVMEKYINIFVNGYAGYANYLVKEVLNPSWHNYFYWLVGASLVIWLLELCFPWRKDQPAIRQDFWLDLFYTFWNYFLFSLIIYNAASNVFVELFNDFLRLFGVKNLVAIQLGGLPVWGQLLFIFVFRDFMQYFIHRLLHRVPRLWEFHKVHHSTEQMGFGGLLKYHFVENIVYRTLEYIPLAMLGFGISDFFIVHIFTLITGQLGHANLYLPLGKFKYILNGPQMHLWHHARQLPAAHKYGFNYGITLSVWDYIFGTVHWPHNDPDLPVGLPPQEHFPHDFVGQTIEPFRRRK